jgi:DNA-binding MarR family transcriptional regulator
VDDRAYREQLAEKKKESTLQILFRCARLANERALSSVTQRPGAPRIRPSHTALFPHIALEGTRLTALADAVGVSKQAIGQLVDELEQMGVLERRPDPDDGRARLVIWTARGRAGLLEGLRTLTGLERELRTAIGARNWDQLRASLLALDAHLDPVTAADDERAVAAAARRRRDPR